MKKNTKEAKKAENQAPSGLPSPAAESGALGAQQEDVGRIREILFGVQMRDYESRFVALEARLARDLDELRKRMLEGLDSLRSDLTERLEAEHSQRREEAESIRQALSSESQELTRKLEESAQELTQLIERHAAELGSRKADRELLAELLLQSAERIRNPTSSGTD